MKVPLRASPIEKTVIEGLAANQSMIAHALLTENIGAPHGAAPV
jgi:hypothetical protein